ncbi:MAG: hypothetical protein M3Z64_06040 [Verrucomicrobiota bacterium]|nr:hypothetical protein [Verrucomicrobiota bacterium]
MHLKSHCLIAVLLLGAIVGRAEPLVPSADGTTWRYAVNDEPGGPSEVTVRIAGTEQFEGKTLLKFETLNDDAVKTRELIAVDERGVTCFARSGRDGILAKLEPPQLILPGALKVGGSFDVEGDLAGVKMQQHFTIAAEENVLVPAGSFRAFRLHCDASSLMKATVDRWYVPGIGLVKDVTAVRGPSGGLLQRTTMELQKKPEVISRPTPSPTPAPAATPTLPPPSPTVAAADSGAPSPTPSASPKTGAEDKRLTAEVSADPNAGQQTEFHSDVEKIYVRWQGNGLPDGARIRVAWVAEDVGDLVEPNFVVDQTETVAPAPDAHARFTLGRPEDGWAEGKYRVEFYIDDKLEETIPVTILK